VLNINTKTPKRIELKEVFKVRDLCDFERKLMFSPLRFSKTYSQRRINSLYFDSIDLNSLEESIEGFTFRTKLRLRWYGIQKSQNAATLEIKRKNGIFSWKNLYSNQFTVNPMAKRWDSFIWANSICCPHALRRTQSLRKVSIISYDRKYYQSFNRKVRITIDDNLISFDQRRRIHPNLMFGRQHLNQIVVEVKVDASDAEILPVVFNQLPFSPKRFSKYCESLIHPNYI
jgi:hypothetical protein